MKTKDKKNDEGLSSNEFYRHLCLAEAGKLAVTKSKYTEGLDYLRAALSLSVRLQAPVIFSRHYVDCIIDTLEQANEYEQALRILEQAIEERELHKNQTPIHQLDHAHNLLRCSILLFKLGLEDEATQALHEAKDSALDNSIPMLDKLVDWRNRGFSIQAHSILDIQKKTNYFLVRRDQLRLEIAKMAPPYSLIQKGVI